MFLDIGSRMQKLYSNCQEWLQSLPHQKQQCIRENFGKFPDFHQIFQCRLLYEDSTGNDGIQSALDEHSSENKLVFLNTTLSYPFSEQLKQQQKYREENKHKKKNDMQHLRAICAQNAQATARMHKNYSTSQQPSFSECENRLNKKKTRSLQQETKPNTCFKKVNETCACCCTSKNQCGPKKCLVLSPQEQSILHQQHFTMPQQATTFNHLSHPLSRNFSQKPSLYANKIDFLDDCEPQWLWWLLAVMPFDDRAKLMLLSSSCISVRLLAVEQTLQFISQTDWR